MSKQKNKWISLIIIAILIGLIWRLEVEYYGWHGLIWISYFHLAIPVGFFIFMSWVNMTIKLNVLNRIYFNVVALIIGVTSFYLLFKSLEYNYSSGPSGLWLLFTTPRWEFYFYRYLPIGITLLLPISILLNVRLFGYYVSVRYLLLSIIGLVFSIPFSIIVLWVTNHIGGPNIIHAIKSGIVFPFIIISLGLLIVKAKRNIKETIAFTQNNNEKV